MNQFCMRSKDRAPTIARRTAPGWARRLAAVLMAGAVAAVPAAWSQAQNNIRAITMTTDGGNEVVRVELDKPLTELPKGFSIQAPARIALDFAGMGNGTGRTALEISQGNVRSVNVVEAGDRTRLVLNLAQASQYQAQISGNSLLVVLQGSVAAGAPRASSQAPFAEARSEDVLPLRGIDFRRGAQGAGRVIVDLPNSQVGVDIRQQGKLLVVEFLKASLPDALRRRLDVTDFGTPIHAVTATQNGDRVRLQVEPRGTWEHSAYQSESQFVLEVREVKQDPNKLSQGPGFTGEKLSLNFQNIEVRALLQVIADFTNFNVVTSDTVAGTVTLRLQDVPWDQALDIILQAKGLGMKKNGNVLWIAPLDELTTRREKELEAQNKEIQQELVRTQAFKLNYVKAEDLATRINGFSIKPVDGNRSLSAQGISTDHAGLLSSRGVVIPEPRTNQLFVTDIPSALERVTEMIAKLDIPVPQVLIEARIVEADDKFSRSLGVRLGGSDLRGVRGGDAGYSVGGGNRVAIGGSYNAVSSTTVESANTLNTTNTNFVNMPAISIGGVTPATFAASLFSPAANRFLNLEISALQADGRGKIVSSPRVITASQMPATIEQGVEFPYPVASASGATAVQFRKASLKLEVTPQITPEGSIILDVEVNKDSPGELLAGGRAINTKRIKTQVLVENGGTVVIGGIYESTETDGETKVPFLGDVPVLGNLFKTRSREANKSELLVFLTPKVVTERGGVR